VSVYEHFPVSINNFSKSSNSFH